MPAPSEIALISIGAVKKVFLLLLKGKKCLKNIEDVG